MQLTINYRQTACRLLAALFFFLLLAPIAAGEEVSPPDSNWKDQISDVDRLANKDGGDGTSWKTPILIATAKELAYFAKKVNEGEAITYGNGSGTAQIEPNGKDQDAGGFKGYYFALSADIDLKDHYWTPIGTENNLFNGNFDGQGHCVSGLKVDVNGNDSFYAGLFGNAAFSTLQNLGVRLAEEGVRATNTDTMGGNLYAGGIAGQAQNVHNCYVVGEGSIEINGGGNGYAGGIVGNLKGTGSLTNCYATVDIKIETKGTRHAGGIVGFCKNGSTISYTYATGDVETVTGEMKFYAGGICGYLNGSSTIENSLALNGRIAGGSSSSNRIVGHKETDATLTTNYASPDIKVNGKTVENGADGDENGNPDVNLDNFGNVFSGGAGWDTSDKTHLPKLKIRTGDGPNYDDWPTDKGFTPQSPPDATLYLIAGKIANAGDGDGLSWKNAIQIANRAELAYLAKQVNAKGNLTVAEGVDGGSIENKTGDDSGFKGIYFALANDIDLSDYWTPIGTFSTPFNGNFDGKGHCVNGLKVKVIENKVKGAYAGLFGNANVGTIQNVGVCLAKEGVRATITNTGGGNLHAGGIAGYALNVHNCYVVGEGSIEINGGSSGYAGGIVGALASGGSLTNCYATVDITIENSLERYAGGIVGFCNYNSTISCTYATGDVETGTGNSNFYAGGICGYLGSTSTIQNSLALNGWITGGYSLSNRIVGKKYSNASLTTNYASPEIVVNGKTFPDTDNLIDNENGANTLLSSFEADLKKEPAGDANGWVTSWTFTSGYLPQLKKKISDDKYGEWGNEQPQLNASRYLPPRLYIIEPLPGGTLTVTDDAGKPLTDGSTVISGTVLTLAKTLESGYVFDAYLVSSDGSNFTDHIDGTIVMPDHDLYLSARFKEEQKPEPEPPYIPPTPIYYSVYLPQVEGATTDPGPGEHEVESWDNFRFYLTIDSAYSESQPVVTTDRGETLVPRSSDGAYLVKYVRTDVEVFIDGLIQNPPPVANEAISTDALAPQIWAEGTMLCIRMPEALPSAPVRIFTVDGRLYDSFDSTPGLNRRQLPTGIYIVRVGETVRKVVVPKT